MQIAFHIGANCTDGDKILKSLQKNADVFADAGIALPNPAKYRTQIRETITAMKDAAPEPGTRDRLLAPLLDEKPHRRVILNNDNFIAVPKRIFDFGVFYHQVGPKIRALRDIFAEDDLSLYLGIRNPATFLQETANRAGVASLEAYLGLMKPTDLKWSDVVRRIKESAPDVPLTVWCNEDTPLLWEMLIREISGVSSQTAIKGGFDMLSSIINREGMAKLTAALQSGTPMTAQQEFDLITSVWETHGIEDRLEDEIQMPELTPALIDHMTEAYDADVAKIAGMAGVNVLLAY